MHCHWCKKKVDRLVNLESDKICIECSKDVCLFCDPPVLNKICPGHDIVQSKLNRFASDREFTDNMLFEFESGNEIGPARK